MTGPPATSRSPGRRESALVLLLRIVGAGSLLALPFVAVPHGWMADIHQWLGMGELPDRPVVSYLARSTSFFYALLGGLMWLLSGDVRRHRAVVVYLGAALLVFGVVIGIIDSVAGLPLFWRVGEAPINVTIGLLFLVLGRAVGEGESTVSRPPT